MRLRGERGGGGERESGRDGGMMRYKGCKDAEAVRRNVQAVNVTLMERREEKRGGQGRGGSGRERTGNEKRGEKRSGRKKRGEKEKEGKER